MLCTLRAYYYVLYLNFSYQFLDAGLMENCHNGKAPRPPLTPGVELIKFFTILSCIFSVYSVFGQQIEEEITLL